MKQIKKRWLVGVGALLIAATTISTVAFFSDRVDSELKVSTATFSGDGYTLSRTFTEGTYGGGDTVEIGLNESSSMDEPVSSVIEMTAKWETDSGEKVFDNATAADNIEFQIDGNPIPYVVESSSLVRFRLPKQEITAGGNTSRTLHVILPDSLSAAGTITLEFESAVVAQSPVGFTREYGKEDLNSPVSLTVSFDTQNPIPILQAWSDKENTDFHDSQYRQKITSAEFVDAAKIPDVVAAGPWDVSENKDKSVMAWLTDDGENGYDLTIAGNGYGEIIANENSSYLFSDFTHLESIKGLSVLNTSGTKDMSYMFSNANALAELDLSGWDTRSLERADNTFDSCTSLSEITLGSGIRDFTIFQAPYLDSLTTIIFNHTAEDEVILPANGAFYVEDFVETNIITENEAIENYDWESDHRRATIKTMPILKSWADSRNEDFHSYKYKSKIKSAEFVDTAEIPAAVAAGPWDVSEKENGSVMAWVTDDGNGGYALTISGNGYGSIIANKDSSYLFDGFYNLKKITGLELLDTSSVTNMECMFAGCIITNLGDLSNWDVSSVTDMSEMFRSSRLTNLDLSNWDVSSVTDMSGIFAHSNFLTNLGEISNWDVSSVTDMSDMFTRCMNLITVGDLSDWDTSSVTDMSGMFSACESLTSLEGLDAWDVSSVTDMSSMFNYCENLTALNLNDWDTSSVTSMSAMFKKCESLSELDLSSWDTSSVTNMSGMFNSCTNLITVGDLSDWDTSSVTDMGLMFIYCDHLNTVGDLSGWDTSSVTNMGDMFHNCSELTTIGNLDKWNTSSVTNMGFMFYNCIDLTTLGHLDNWDISSVTRIDNMFGNCRSLSTVGDLSGWDTSSVTTMHGVFESCESLEQIGDIGTWDVSSVRDMSYMFQLSGISLDDLSNWNVSSVTDMRSMFHNCKNLKTLNLSSWDTSSVESMYQLFCGCNNLTSIEGLDEWDVSSVTDMGRMFQGCRVKTFNLENWDVSSVTRMGEMFYGPGPIEIKGTGNWNLPSLTSTWRMFYSCSNLETVDLSNWKTPVLTTMDEMFSGCSKLSSIGEGGDGWKMSSATSLSNVFSDCKKLTTLDLSNWDVSSVTDMSYLFDGCSELSELDLSGWDTSSVKKMSCMFFGCSKLSGLDLSKWDTSSVTDMRQMFNSCRNLLELDLSGWDVSSITTMAYMFNGCSSLNTVYVKDAAAQEKFQTLPINTPSRVQFIIKDANSLNLDLNGGSVAEEHTITYDLNGGEIQEAA